MPSKLSAVFVISLGLLKADDSKPGTDVLLFADGERLTGHFVKAAGSSLTFKSDAVGEITVDWSKVKELTTSVQVAVIPKDVRIRKPSDAATIPQGTLTASDQQLHLAAPQPGTPRSIPVADAGLVIDQAGFHNAIEHQPGFFKDWKGTVTVGAAVVSATQSSQSFNGAAGLVRAIPGENWLEPRNRTSLNLSAAYGAISEPNSPPSRPPSFMATPNGTNTSARAFTSSGRALSITIFHKAWTCSKRTAAVSAGR